MILNKNDSKDPKNKKNLKKENFFKRLIKSIKDFDKYEDFGIEGIGKTTIYLIQMVAIFTLVVTIMTTYKFSNTFNSGIQYFDENVNSLSYNDGILNINENKYMEIKNDNKIIEYIIIDTSDLNNDKIQEYKNIIMDKNNAAVILKDKVLIKNEMLAAITESNYKDIFNQHDVNNFDKQFILNYFNNNQFSIYSSIFIIMYIYMFMIYIANVLVDALVLGVLGYLTARITKMKIRFGAAFSIGVHALTLPIILNILYVILNGITGYTIEHFQFMYTAISYIYVITAILIIKSDYIKTQTELQKILSEQEKVHAELEQKTQEQQDEEAKRKQEKERKDQKEKERKEKKSKDKKTGDVPDIGEKPEGSNV